MGAATPSRVTPSTRPPDDPPIFLLQAAPTWMGGTLPDGVWQRVPIGVTGQVLTVQADGSIAWITGGAGFSNPMTTAGDIIDGGAAGVPQRLAIGTVGQQLTVLTATTIGWSSAGLTNPMTAQYDLIQGGVAGAPLRLAAGSAGQLLSMSPGGVLAWGQGPMTALGDILVGGATIPTRLAIGSNGQVLTISGGVPTWQNASSGFANPMTTTGDMIFQSGAGPARLGIGANAQVLTVAGGLPVWSTPSGGAGVLPFTVVPASGDTSGATDLANINAAFAAMPNADGLVWLLSGNYYIPAAGLSVPPYSSLWGQGHNTVLNYVGGGLPAPRCCISTRPAQRVTPACQARLRTS
jgi:hypothetical protein